MILYPTETVYALGVLALDEVEIAKLFQLRNRLRGNTVSWLVRDLIDIERYAHVDVVAAKIAEQFLPGPLTLVLKARDEVPCQFISSSGTIGFRISSDPITQKLILDFMSTYDAPLTCTSANVSGLPTLPTVPEILEQFRQYHQVNTPVNWSIYDDGPRAEVPSTVVEIVENEVTILREGVISSRAIMEVVLK